MSITVESGEVATNTSIQVTARFRAADGSSVADGTQVTLNSSNSNRGVVAADEAGASSGASATATTSGGQANFIFTARSNTGTVTLTASGNNPSGSGTVSATRDIDVVEGGDGEARLEIIGANTMPANTEGVEIFLGSPFITELTVRYRNPDGTAGNVTDGQIQAAIAPVSRAAFSTLDDPETDDVNEFLVLVGNGPVNMAAGQASIFVHSFDEPGTVTVTVSAQDANSGDTFSEEFVIEIAEGAADFLPANLDFSVPTAPVYIQGSGGSTTKSMSLFVGDSGDNAVPNPEGGGAEFNNVILSLDAPDGSGARLNGTGADGSVNGSEISVQTVNGVANFSLSTGSETGPHRITATADRADNNVDNDLLDPISAETTVDVGDGRLFGLEIVSPSVSAILANNTVGFIDYRRGAQHRSGDRRRDSAQRRRYLLADDHRAGHRPGRQRGAVGDANRLWQNRCTAHADPAEAVRFLRQRRQPGRGRRPVQRLLAGCRIRRQPPDRGRSRRARGHGRAVRQDRSRQPRARGGAYRCQRRRQFDGYRDQ